MRTTNLVQQWTRFFIWAAFRLCAVSHLCFGHKKSAYNEFHFVPTIVCSFLYVHNTACDAAAILAALRFKTFYLYPCSV